MSCITITDSQIVTASNASVIKNGIVIIRDGRIESVGTVNSVEIPADANVIRAEGTTVIPGLIDGHMHVTGMPEHLDHWGHVEHNIRAVGKLQECLKWGTTMVANVGGSRENVILRELIKNDAVRGCSRLLVGAMVNATGGHVRGRSADGPWEIRKAVREMVRDGVDFIKTAASGGFMWEHERIETEDYTEEELNALVAEAHARHKRVAVHAHAQPGLNHSIAAGCDIITHGALIDEEALEGISRKNLFFMPTLYITSEPVWQNPARPRHMRDRMEQAFPIHRAGVKRAHALGVIICAGTDGGPGDVNKELHELVKCGLNPLEAIIAGTRNTADALGLLAQSGTLEPGKLADLVVVRGNLLEDITLLRNREHIQLVMKAGKLA